MGDALPTRSFHPTVSRKTAPSTIVGRGSPARTVNNDTGVILRTTWGPTSYESFSAFPNGTRGGEGGHERTTRGYPTDSPLRGRLRANSSYVSQLLIVDAVGKSRMARLLALDPSVGLPGSKLRV
ncbi:hypothetical protein B0H10DRAFT_2207636 [Mycena sp. CBHHK59/15]|nr:hypothetical protein B0H10DRAFT_2207636 [Mycena sp. CBHHK59/15]